MRQPRRSPGATWWDWAVPMREQFRKKFGRPNSSGKPYPTDTEVVNRAYEQTSLIVITNLPFEN